MAWRCRIAANSAPSRRANRASLDRASKNVRRATVGRPVTTTLRSWRVPSTRAFLLPVIALMSLPMVNLCAMRGLERTETQPAFSGPCRRKPNSKEKTVRRHALRPLNSDRPRGPSQASPSVQPVKRHRGPVRCPLRDPIGRKSSLAMREFPKNFDFPDRHTPKNNTIRLYRPTYCIYSSSRFPRLPPLVSKLCVGPRPAGWEALSVHR